MKTKSRLLLNKIVIIAFCLCIILNAYTITCYARDNTALSVSTSVSNLDTTEVTNVAAQYYADVGYTSYVGCDLTASVLYSYLYADVQFFACHGAQNNINFKESGIIKGANYSLGGINYIGTDNVYWDADTILVTYLACNTALDSSWDTISGATCTKGANTVVGFNETININSATPWAKRYNQKLAEGGTVYEAATYANSFMYLYPSVKTLTIYGDSELKIGNMSSTASISNTENIQLAYSENSHIKIYDYAKKGERISTINEIISKISESDENFDINNYEILNNEGITVVENQESEKELKGEYIELIFKIGDFYTNAGYTIYLEDGIVKEIYDNNIDLEKQEEILKNEELLNYEISSSEISMLKSRASKDVEVQYMNRDLNIEKNMEEKLYYDIENEQKYLIIEVESSLDNNSIAYDSVFYEIN